MMCRALERLGYTACNLSLNASVVMIRMGHTYATYEEVREGIQHGVTHINHCFNAMRPLSHRLPGPLAAVVQAPQVLGELIADGVHVHPAVMNALVKMLGAERTIVITDALAAAGIGKITFDFPVERAKVICGASHLAAGTL